VQVCELAGRQACWVKLGVCRFLRLVLESQREDGHQQEPATHSRSRHLISCRRWDTKKDKPRTPATNDKRIKKKSWQKELHDDYMTIIISERKKRFFQSQHHHHHPSSRFLKVIIATHSHVVTLKNE
jgi:hypothetical protein